MGFKTRKIVYFNILDARRRVYRQYYKQPFLSQITVGLRDEHFPYGPLRKGKFYFSRQIPSACIGFSESFFQAVSGKGKNSSLHRGGLGGRRIRIKKTFIDFDNSVPTLSWVVLRAYGIHSRSGRSEFNFGHIRVRYAESNVRQKVAVDSTYM